MLTLEAESRRRGHGRRRGDGRHARGHHPHARRAAGRSRSPIHSGSRPKPRRRSPKPPPDTFRAACCRGGCPRSRPPTDRRRVGLHAAGHAALLSLQEVHPRLPGADLAAGGAGDPLPRRRHARTAAARRRRAGLAGADRRCISTRRCPGRSSDTWRRSKPNGASAEAAEAATRVRGADAGSRVDARQRAGARRRRARWPAVATAVPRRRAGAAGPAREPLHRFASTRPRPRRLRAPSPAQRTRGPRGRRGARPQAHAQVDRPAAHHARPGVPGRAGRRA